MHRKRILCAWPTVWAQEGVAPSLLQHATQLPLWFKCSLRSKDIKENKIPHDLLAVLVKGFCGGTQVLALECVWAGNSPFVTDAGITLRSYSSQTCPPVHRPLPPTGRQWPRGLFPVLTPQSPVPYGSWHQCSRTRPRSLDLQPSSTLSAGVILQTVPHLSGPQLQL